MYIFDVVKFIESCIEDGNKYEDIGIYLQWAMECHNKPVDMTKELWGYCGSYKVSIDWCREIQ